MPTIARGATKDVSATVHNGNRIPDDPASLTLTLRDPDGVALAGFPVLWPPDGDLTRDGVGQFHYEWTVAGDAAEGTYIADWGGVLDGLPVIGVEYWEVVAPGTIDPGMYLSFIDPEDYDGIRHLLGVERIDLPDTTIESYPFAPNAEMQIKGRISNWETQLADPDGAQVLRLATAYLTASLIAEGYVMGGTLGHIRPKEEVRDWAKLAQTLATRFGEWFVVLEENDEPSTEEETYFDLSMVALSGPTRWRNYSEDIPETEWLKYPPVIPSGEWPV